MIPQHDLFTESSRLNEAVGCVSFAEPSLPQIFLNEHHSAPFKQPKQNLSFLVFPPLSSAVTFLTNGQFEVLRSPSFKGPLVLIISLFSWASDVKVVVFCLSRPELLFSWAVLKRIFKFFLHYSFKIFRTSAIFFICALKHALFWCCSRSCEDRSTIGLWGLWVYF